MNENPTFNPNKQDHLTSDCSHLWFHVDLPNTVSGTASVPSRISNALMCLTHSYFPLLPHSSSVLSFNPFKPDRHSLSNVSKNILLYQPLIDFLDISLC